MDLSNFSLAELRDLERQIPREIRRRSVEEKANVRRKLEAMAQEMGFTLAEVIGGRGVRHGAEPLAAKYRHPQQPDLTWSGRGRKPRWVETWLSNGGDLSQLVI
jgi:DNA-binding protein H-NS